MHWEMVYAIEALDLLHMNQNIPANLQEASGKAP